MAKVLVTGGTGNIGSYVLADLLDAGHEVGSFDLRNNTANLDRLGIQTEVDLFEGDITNAFELIEALERFGATAVIHLVTFKTGGGSVTSVESAELDPRSALEVNVLGSSNVFEAARILDQQLDRVVGASSTAVYGAPDQYEDTTIDEGDPMLPETHYGATKQYVEHLSRTYESEFGQRIVAIRPHNIFGPNMVTPQWIAEFIRTAATGRSVTVPYSAGETLSMCYVKDIAQAFRRALEVPADRLTQRAFNIRGEVLTVGELVETVESLVPEATVDVPPASPFEWSHVFDLSAAREQLGYKIEYDFEAGAHEFINIVRESEGLEPV